MNCFCENASPVFWRGESFKSENGEGHFCPFKLRLLGMMARLLIFGNMGLLKHEFRNSQKINWPKY